MTNTSRKQVLEEVQDQIRTLGPLELAIVAECLGSADAEAMKALAANFSEVTENYESA